MQESQETHISNHLDEIVAAVSITPRKKLQHQLLQRALFQPPREKLRLSEEKAKSYASSHEVRDLSFMPVLVTEEWPTSGCIRTLGACHERECVAVPFGSVSETVPQGTVSMPAE